MNSGIYFSANEDLSLREIRRRASEIRGNAETIRVEVDKALAHDAIDLPGFVPIYLFNHKTLKTHAKPGVIGAVEKFILVVAKEGRRGTA